MQRRHDGHALPYQFELVRILILILIYHAIFLSQMKPPYLSGIWKERGLAFYLILTVGQWTEAGSWSRGEDSLECHKNTWVYTAPVLMSAEIAVLPHRPRASCFWAVTMTMFTFVKETYLPSGSFG